MLDICQKYLPERDFGFSVGVLRATVVAPGAILNVHMHYTFARRIHQAEGIDACGAKSDFLKAMLWAELAGL